MRPLGMRRSLIVDRMRQLARRRTVIAPNQRGPATPRDEGQLNAKSLTEGDDGLDDRLRLVRSLCLCNRRDRDP